MNEYERVSLKEYVEALVRSAEAKADLRLKGTERAVEVAEQALTKRLEQMNEIRSQLTEQALRFATKEYVEAIEKRINSLVWGGVLALIGIVTGFIVNALFR